MGSQSQTVPAEPATRKIAELEQAFQLKIGKPLTRKAAQRYLNRFHELEIMYQDRGNSVVKGAIILYDELQERLEGKLS